MLRADFSVLHGKNPDQMQPEGIAPQQAESWRRHRNRNLADLIDFGGLGVRVRHFAPGMEHRCYEEHERNVVAGWGAGFETRVKLRCAPTLAGDRVAIIGLASVWSLEWPLGWRWTLEWLRSISVWQPGLRSVPG